jgi:hypothetical protein
MVSVLASSEVDRRFKPGCFSAKHAAFGRKSKDWLAWNTDNVSDWSVMSTRELLLQWASTIQIQLGVLVYYIIISLKMNLSPWYSWKIVELALNNNQSPTHSLTHLGPLVYLLLKIIKLVVFPIHLLWACMMKVTSRGLLNSIISPMSKQCTGPLTTHRNKHVNGR